MNKMSGIKKAERKLAGLCYNCDNIANHKVLQSCTYCARTVSIFTWQDLYDEGYILVSPELRKKLEGI